MSTSSTSAELIKAGQLLQYCAAIGPVILVYDSLLKIDTEIRHVWQQPWSPLKLLYICARYLPFADTTVMMLYRNFLSAPSIDTCKVLMSCQLWLYVIGITLSELIFMFRTWAVWKNDWRVGAILLLTGGICLVSAIVGIQEFIGSLEFVAGSGVEGCLIWESNNMLLIDWSVFITMETLLLGLVLYPTYITYKQGHKICKLMQVVVRDGVLYYAVLFMLTLVNLVVTALPQLRFTAVVLTTPTRILHSIFAARMVLHIRQIEPEENDPDAVLLSTLAPTYFDPNPCAGELGQTETQSTDDVA